MKLLDIVQIVGVVIVTMLAVAGLLKRKALNALLLIYAGILVVGSIYYAVGYFHVTTSAPLLVYVAVNVVWSVVWSVVCLVALGVIRRTGSCRGWRRSRFASSGIRGCQTR